MSAIFSLERKLEIWLDVELAAARAMADLGIVPADEIDVLIDKAATSRDRLIDPVRVDEIEQTTRHDVIAFLTHVEDVCGQEARFLHQGLTSSDLLDTTLAIQMREAARLVLNVLDGLLDALKTRALEQRYTACIGRSHGIHAEPTTMGLKLLTFHAELARARKRIEMAREEISTCAMSGAVGTFANVSPKVEAAVARAFDLVPEPISTQVIPRDRHASMMAALGIMASSLERLAVEVRHLQRSEVREAEEFFHAGQKGSSAMPHKRNPVLSENLVGLARMIRAAVEPAMENIALWHERDISHSSVERVMVPDAFILADFALSRATGMIARLVIYPERMKRNLDASHGLYNSQRVLLALTESGLGRQEAYALVQSAAMQAWREERPLLHVLEQDEVIVDRLGMHRLRALFDLEYHLAHVDEIFARVLD